MITDEEKKWRKILDKREDFLLNGLPCVFHIEEDSYIVFSPYNQNVAAISMKEFADKASLVKKLEHKGFFSAPVKETSDSRRINITLTITGKCSLDCVYCYMKRYRNIEDMDFDSAREAINLMVRRNPEAEAIGIMFFGGEPTLKFELIHQIVDYVKTLRKKVTFHISTNGLLSEDILRYFVDENFRVGLSMDSLPLLNKQFRLSAKNIDYSMMIEGVIKYLVKRGVRFLVRATLFKENLDLFLKALDYWADLGVKFVHFELANVVNVNNQITSPSVSKYVNTFRRVLKKASERELFLISSPFVNLLTPSKIYCSSACGDGFIFTSHSISTCYQFQDFLPDDSLSKNFIVGKSDDGHYDIDELKLKHALRFNCQYNECEGCFAQYVCGGGCPARNLTANGVLGKVDLYMCEVSKLIIKEIVLEIYKMAQSGEEYNVPYGINLYEDGYSFEP